MCGRTILYSLIVLNAGYLFTFVAGKITLHPSQKNLEPKEGSNYVIICEYDRGKNGSWYDNTHTLISSNRNTNKYVELNSPTQLQLEFRNLTLAHSGVYTCMAGDESERVNLTVIRPISFTDHQSTFYVSKGANGNIHCRPNSIPQAQITWFFNGSQIDGDDYKTYDSNTGLYILNVTEDKLGEYQCNAILTTALSSDFQPFRITVKLARPPVFHNIYPNNTVHAPMDSSVQIVCRVTADPSAELQWYRKGEKLQLRDLNASIEQKDNESKLKLNFTDNKFLGQYTCVAKNEFGRVSTDFTLIKGINPNVPVVHGRESFDTGYRLDISQSPPAQNLSNFRVLYRKANDNSTEWEIVDFELKNSETIPYTLDKLEPNTEYVYKTGACTFIDLCAYTNESYFKTAVTTTGSANSYMQTIFTQVVTLLPAFLISFYSQHR